MDKDEWTQMDIDGKDKSKDIKYTSYELIIEREESKIDDIFEHYKSFFEVFSGLKPREVTFTGLGTDLLEDIYTFDKGQKYKLMSHVRILAYNDIKISEKDSFRSFAESEEYLHKTLESLTIAQYDDNFQKEFFKVSKVYKFLKVFGFKNTDEYDNDQIREKLGGNKDLIIIRS